MISKVYLLSCSVDYRNCQNKVLRTTYR